jgi:ferrochelatase
MQSPSAKTGVVLMTYGSATTAEHVEEYLRHIYGERVRTETIEEFKRRYAAIGRSPLVDITRAQAEALEAVLGEEYVVRSGMRHSDPYIADAVGELRAAGARRLVGIILSPQFSSFIMDGYRTDFEEAARTHGYAPADAILVGPWAVQPDFIDFLALSVDAALETLGDVPVIFTTHSLPQRVVDQDPSYLEQLSATTSAVLAAMKRAPSRHQSAYQSAGHSPEAWLTPDLVDVVKEMNADGATDVLIVPIQFLSDHLEVLYDLDIAAREQCAALGVGYHRIDLPNTDPRFIRALAMLVRGV